MSALGLLALGKVTHVAVCCSVLQCVAVCCEMMSPLGLFALAWLKVC